MSARILVRKHLMSWKILAEHHGEKVGLIEEEMAFILNPEDDLFLMLK